jgi:hypothetical protein
VRLGTNDFEPDRLKQLLQRVVRKTRVSNFDIRDSRLGN